MTKLTIAIVAASALSLAFPALAQQASKPSGAPSHSGYAPDRSSIPMGAAIRGQYESFLDGSTGHNLVPQPLERIDRANRVSVLIELGRCSEARAVANEAGDRQMALRARQLCRADRRQG